MRSQGCSTLLLEPAHRFSLAADREGNECWRGQDAVNNAGLFLVQFLLLKQTQKIKFRLALRIPD